MDIQALYQELIIDHGTAPRHFEAMLDFTNVAEGFNPLCGDKIKLYLSIENSVIKKISFQGNGCAISTASASLMTEALVNKTVTEGMHFFSLFQQMQTGALCDEAQLPPKLLALKGVAAFPSRIKCVTLPWHTYKAAIEQNTAPISTEELNIT